MKPRCTTECAQEVRSLNEEKQRLVSALVAANQKVIDITRDRDEWRTQHENLLAMYREAIKRPAGKPPTKDPFNISREQRDKLSPEELRALDAPVAR